MNPRAKPFKPNSKTPHLNCTNHLSKSDSLIFQEICAEWANTPTLDGLLESWKKRSDKTMEMLSMNQEISLLLLNVASLNLYLIEVINLINSVGAPIIILNGTHHDDKTVKHLSSYMFNMNVFASKGSNAFGGVLIGVHKSIRAVQVTQFSNINNLIVLEMKSDAQIFQLVTCYSPPSEPLPLTIFDQILQRNSNTVFAGDFNAKHVSWSRSVGNQKGRALAEWMASNDRASSHVVINKAIPTSTRSNATIDLFIAPAHMASNSFSVLPSMGSDHHPVIWYPPFKMPSVHLRCPIKRTRWRLLEVFLTFTAPYWNSLSTTMTDAPDLFSLYERFLSLAASRFTFVSFQQSYRPSLPAYLIDLIEQKQNALKVFRKSRHPIHAVTLRSLSKLVRHHLFAYKRTSWLNYCETLDKCDVQSFWKKAKRHFNSRAPPIEGFIVKNATISSPLDMCQVAVDHYKDQFAAHPLTGTPIEKEANSAECDLEQKLANVRSSPIPITYP